MGKVAPLSWLCRQLEAIRTSLSTQWDIQMLLTPIWGIALDKCWDLPKFMQCLGSRMRMWICKLWLPVTRFGVDNKLSLLVEGMATCLDRFIISLTYLHVLNCFTGVLLCCAGEEKHQNKLPPPRKCFGRIKVFGQILQHSVVVLPQCGAMILCSLARQCFCRPRECLLHFYRIQLFHICIQKQMAGFQWASRGDSLRVGQIELSCSLISLIKKVCLLQIKVGHTRYEEGVWAAEWVLVGWLSCGECLAGGWCFRLQDADDDADLVLQFIVYNRPVAVPYRNPSWQQHLSEFHPPQLLTFSFGLLLHGEKLENGQVFTLLFS